MDLIRLQRVQNRAARLVTQTKTQDHITPVLRDFHWLPVSSYMNIARCRFLHNHGNIATEGGPKPILCPTLISMTSRVLYSAQYHRQHCTLYAFEQLGALYMHNHNDKYPS